MSTDAPATSIIPSTCAIESPRSSTCVMPSSRGLMLRSGRLTGTSGSVRTGPLLLGLVGAHRHDDARLVAGHRLRAGVDRDDLLGRDAQERGDPARRVLEPVGVGDLRGLLGLVGRVGEAVGAVAGLL